MGRIIDFKEYKKNKNRDLRRKSIASNKPYIITGAFIALLVLMIVLLDGYTYTPATYSLIGINGIVFALIRFKKFEWYRLSSSCGDVLDRKEFYRIASAAFTHVEVLHILMNMMSLQNMGEVLEPFLGTKLFVAAYIILMLAGGILSCVLHRVIDPNVNSIGASGVICGLLGIYIVFVVAFYGIGGLRSCAFTLFLLAMMVFSKRIDNIGHLAGLIVGVLFGLVLLVLA